MFFSQEFVNSILLVVVVMVLLVLQILTLIYIVCILFYCFKMINNYSKNKKPINLDLNKFFKKIFIKKQYIKQLKNKIILLNNIKKPNYKVFDSQLIKNYNDLSIKKVSEISYIIDFSFSRTNTTLHIMDCSGNSKFFYSAGLFDFKGKQKKFQLHAILKKFYKVLVHDSSFLKYSPIAIHFKNKNLNYRVSWFLKKLRKKLFIVVVKFFTAYPYNGCRRKKPKRKKFRKKVKIWLSG